MRKFAYTIALALTLLAAPALAGDGGSLGIAQAAAVEHKTCTSFEDALAKLKTQINVTYSVKLTKAQSAVVLADYNNETGQGVDADVLYVIKAKPEDSESERVGVAFTLHGCMLGISVVNPSHLDELLGRGA